MKCLHGLWVLALWCPLLWSQTNPGAKEDAEEARLKLLRAVDQLDAMQHQLDAIRVDNEKGKADLEKVKTDLETEKTANALLKADIATLKTALEKLDGARAGEREAIIKEVGKIVAEAVTPKASAAEPTSQSPPKKTNPVAPVSPTPDISPGNNEDKGFYYTVKKGDTLYDIASAYASQGVKVSVDDIRKANKMSKTQVIFAGQKIFVPKKD